MLSVLIPLYNFDCREMAIELVQQLRKQNIAFEVLCFDDASDSALQTTLEKAFATHPEIKLKLLSQNVGRARIRNLLAAAAKHEYLLFLDCDGGIGEPNFIKKYLNLLGEDRVLYGGRRYPEPPAFDNPTYFHWYYGTHRESMSVERRKTHPYQSFMTNNFVIPKAIFDQIGFDETIRGYGHEDTLFGMELAQCRVEIVHLANPVIHLDLETFEDFMSKTDESLQNLLRLGAQYPDFASKLWHTYRRLRSFGMRPILKGIYKLFGPRIKQHLRKPKPNLRWFDLYRLVRLAHLEKGSEL